jgi:hypothetical protein
MEINSYLIRIVIPFQESILQTKRPLVLSKKSLAMPQAATVSVYAEARTENG